MRPRGDQHLRVGRWVVISFSRCGQHAVVVKLEVWRPEVGLHHAERGRTPHHW